MTNEAEKINQKLLDLTAFIEDAQIKLQNNEVVSLMHVDGEVEKLCEQALALPPADIQIVQPTMADMIGKLEALSVALKDFQAHMEERAETMKAETKNENKD